MNARIKVGTTTWAGRGLVQAGWYPPEVKSSEDRLHYYASQFPIVENEANLMNAAAAAERRLSEHFDRVGALLGRKGRRESFARLLCLLWTEALPAASTRARSVHARAAIAGATARGGRSDDLIARVRTPEPARTHEDSTRAASLPREAAEMWPDLRRGPRYVSGIGLSAGCR